MRENQALFYIKAIDLYKDKGVPQKHIDDVIAIAIKELSGVRADDICKYHVELMEKIMECFVVAEEFGKAGVVRDQIKSALAVFEAREEYLKLLNAVKDKKDKDE